VNSNKKDRLNVLADIIVITCWIRKTSLNTFNKYHNYLFCELK